MKQLILTIWNGSGLGDKIKMIVIYLLSIASMSETLIIVQVIAGLSAAAASWSFIYKNLKKDK